VGGKVALAMEKIMIPPTGYTEDALVEQLAIALLSALAGSW